MEAKYGVPLNTYAAKGPMDYQKPDCMAQKYGLLFRATDASGNPIDISDLLSSASIDSLTQTSGTQ